eukprot:2501783-Rhodomonas_salina.1
MVLVAGSLPAHRRHSLLLEPHSADAVLALPPLNRPASIFLAGDGSACQPVLSATADALEVARRVPP